MLYILTRISISFLITLALAGVTSFTYLKNQAIANEVTEHDLGPVVEEVNNQTTEEKPLYEELAREVEEKQFQHRDYVKEFTKVIEDGQENNPLYGAKEGDYVGEMFTSSQKMMKSIKNGKTGCDASTREGFKIFISFSMPKELIKNYDEIARKIGAKLIIRGLINNSFIETISFIKQANDQGMKIDVDPRPFEEFKVNLVPGFVISDNQNFDKLVGNVSIVYALEQFASSGDLSEKAKLYLEKLRNE